MGGRSGRKRGEKCGGKGFSTNNRPKKKLAHCILEKQQRGVGMKKKGGEMGAEWPCQKGKLGCLLTHSGLNQRKESVPEKISCGRLPCLQK